MLKQSFFDDYKGDEITTISRTFYSDIGILVVAFWKFLKSYFEKKGKEFVY